MTLIKQSTKQSARSLLVIGALCALSSYAHAAPRVKIGALLCLSGGCAEFGTNSLRGAKLAAEEINAQGGVLGKQIEIVAQDTHEATSGGHAIQAYHQMMLDKEVKYLVGPTWTPAGQALAPILAKRSDVVATSPSLGVADYNEAAPSLFNVWPHDEAGTRKLARVAIERGWKKVAILSSQQPWEQLQGDVFEEEFSRLGGTVLMKLEPLPDAPSFRTETLKLVRTKPDFIFLSNMNGLAIASKDLTRLNYTGPKMTVLVDDTRAKASDGTLKGTMYITYPEASSGFQKRYLERYGEVAGVAADTAYDVVHLYAKAMQDSNTTDPQKVARVLRQLRFTGASGEIVFDAHGGVVREPIVKVVE